MSGEASGFSGNSKGRSQRTPSNKSPNGDEKLSSKSRNAAQSSAPKPTPSWLSSSTNQQGLEFDLSDPEDLLRQLENVDLTDEETDELLKRALEINKQLKQMESPAYRTGGSAPQGAGTGRPRSRGSSGMMSEGDHLPNLDSRGGRHTSLSSGVYSRVAASSPATSQGSAHYSSYHGAQAAYGAPHPHPPAREKPGSGRRVVYE